MNYPLTIFRGIWEIRTADKVCSRVVCQGSMPNDEASGPVLLSALKKALQATTDQEVKAAMGEWAK